MAKRNIEVDDYVHADDVKYGIINHAHRDSTEILAAISDR